MQKTEESSAKDLFSRRRFVVQAATGISAAWVSAHWPAVVHAAEYAHRAAASAVRPKFEFFTPEEAKEVDAISSRIIPADELPGAHEAGVVYFIDKALVTFDKDNQKTYREGLPEVHARVREMYAGKARFSRIAAEQQDAVLLSLDEHHPSGRRAFRPTGLAPNFFDTIRQHTIAGFLVDPDSGRGGNRDGVGWRAIGRDAAHAFQPPFGSYDKDYPGWKPASEDKSKP
jgi:hypothetical protein